MQRARAIACAAALAVACGAAPGDREEHARTDDGPGGAGVRGAEGDRAAADEGSGGAVADPATGGSGAADPNVACASASDCVLVTGACSRVVGANRAHEADVRAIEERIAGVASCDGSGRGHAPSFVPACLDGACTAVVSD